MRILRNISTYCLMAAAALAASSCDGIYDDPSNIPDDTGGQTFSLVDASSYTNWVYFNLADGSSTTLDYQNTAEIPADWTFAMHRYDCKTNGGSAFETDYTSLDDFSTAYENGAYKLPSASEYTADEDSQITVDMSHMMEGYLVYADSKLNSVLAKWLDVDTSNMPPNYTMSNKVYLIRTADGKVAAVQFTNYLNPYLSSTKGYISFDYIFPLTD